MKVCIVGGGGGASNAANVVRRLDRDAEIHIFTDRSEIGNLPCEIPFVLRGTLPSWESSFAFRERFYKDGRIEVHLNAEVTEIIRAEKRLVAGGEKHSYDKVILNLGAIPAIPSLSGLDGRNESVLGADLKYARAFAEVMPQCTSAAVVGTGQIALEVASILKSKGYAPVYLVGRADHVLRGYLDGDMVGMVEERVKENGIELLLNSAVARVATRGSKKLLFLSDRELEVDLVFFALGSEPNTGLARRAGIELGETGAIAVNDYLQTSDPDIYAIGDCMENREPITGRKVRYQTATNAARSGRIAANNVVLGNVVRHQGTVLAFVTEVYDYEIGTVGFTEEYLRRAGFDVISNVTVTATRRRPFGGKPIHVKLIADRSAQTLLGAQLISEELVAGKIDRLALAIAEKTPVQRLALIDTCYSPTVGAGYEAVTMALDELAERLAGR